MRQFLVELVVMFWVIMPIRARAWAFLNDRQEEAGK